MLTEYKIRVQVIVTADDDGSDAANIPATTITTRLDTANQIYTPASIKFVFDETVDFLKVNSTLLNRDFTPLESTNIDGDKWDHEPLVDSASHARARDDFAKQFAGKLVVIYRNRKKLAEENGVWKISPNGKSGSSANASYVNVSTHSKNPANTLAHEIGHYLQVPHPFKQKTSVAAAADEIKKYVESGHDKDDGLDAIDGDHNVLLDTPADCADEIFVSEGLSVCGVVGEISIPVTFSDNSTRDYKLTPNRDLVMSYFNECPGDKTITEQQARRMRDSLELRHRHELISVKPSFDHNIVSGGVNTAGAVSEVETALVRAGRVATVVRDDSGNLKLIVWDIKDSGNKIIRRGSGDGGAVGKVAICGLGGNMVATPVSTASGRLKIILWRIDENGNVSKLGDASAEGQITDVAASSAHYTMVNNFMATAVRLTDGTLKVAMWETFADGSIKHRASATAGKINSLVNGISPNILSTPRLKISSAGTQSLVAYVRDENGNLKTILWEFADRKNLVRLNDIVIDDLIGSISSCHLAREMTVAAVQDKQKNLKLISYAFPENGKFIDLRGVASAGNISDVEVCRIGTEMVVTGLRTAGDKLKLILWQVTKAGQIARLKDATIDERFSRLSMCYTDQRQLVTALRDSNGKLKIIVWRLKRTMFSGDGEADSFKRLFDKASQAENVRKGNELASGGDECDVET